MPRQVRTLLPIGMSKNAGTWPNKIEEKYGEPNLHGVFVALGGQGRCSLFGSSIHLSDKVNEGR